MSAKPKSNPSFLTYQSKERDPRTTLYEQLGGADAVNLAVDKFYERVLQDDRIKHLFC